MNQPEGCCDGKSQQPFYTYKIHKKNGKIIHSNFYNIKKKYVMEDFL